MHLECIQTDNGFEFTNRFSPSKKNPQTLFEAAAAAKLQIRHKLIRPYTPRHNGKVERSHREDQIGGQLAAHQNRSNNLPMRLSPLVLSCRISSCLHCPKCLTNLQNDAIPEVNREGCIFPYKNPASAVSCGTSCDSVIKEEMYPSDAIVRTYRKTENGEKGNRLEMEATRLRV